MICRFDTLVEVFLFLFSGSRQACVARRLILFTEFKTATVDVAKSDSLFLFFVSVLVARMFAAVLFVTICVEGAAFVSARSFTGVLLRQTSIAGFLARRDFRTAAAEEEATIVFSSGYAFGVYPYSLVFLAIALNQHFGPVLARIVRAFRKGFHFQRLYRSI